MKNKEIIFKFENDECYTFFVKHFDSIFGVNLKIENEIQTDNYQDEFEYVVKDNVVTVKQNYE